MALSLSVLSMVVATENSPIEHSEIPTLQSLVTANKLTVFEQGLFGPVFKSTVNDGRVAGNHHDRKPKISAPRPLSRTEASRYSQACNVEQPKPYSLGYSQEQPIPPRSFLLYPLGQAPEDITMQYDTFISNQQHGDDEDAMEET